MAVFQTGNLRVEKPSPDLAVLWLDVPGRSVNVLNREVRADLEAVLDHLAADPLLRRLVITSAKPGFLAGADLQEFATIRTAEEAVAVSEAGQRLFDRVAKLPVPTTAVIQGSCLGGGLELALACDYRLVIDHPKTQLGLPEIELGLLPGWGGTQRLPRVIGVERALQMILGRRRLNAKEALRWGLADQIAVAGPGLPLSEAAFHLPNAGPAWRTAKRPKERLPLRTWRQRLLESTALGRALLFRGAERVLRRRVPDDMPAPAEALRAVRTGLDLGMEAGLKYEREAIGRLAMTSACHNLVNLFFLNEQSRKPAEIATQPGEQVRRVGVVGAGAMGAGIAQLASVKGFEVVIQEVNEAALAGGLQKVEALFDQAVERGLLTADTAKRQLAAVGRTTTWEGFANVDLVVEAVLEDLSSKQAVFRELDRRTRPTTILASNTSSLPVRELQAGLEHPERVAGLHFFNPVHKMPLVEVARAPATDERTLAQLIRWAADLGKTPVVVRDNPGFVVNRILMPYLNEAVDLVSLGLPIAHIDQVIRRFGMPMGPLELLDQVGLDVAAHIARIMKATVGERFPPHPAFEQMCERGWLGKKTGVGFYRYFGERKRVHEGAQDLLRDESPAARGRAANLSAYRAREQLVLLMVNEAALCLGECLTSGAETIDLAMVLGTGWAPHRGGPLRYADKRGLVETVNMLAELARQVGPRFEPCEELRRRARGGEAFYRVKGMSEVGA
jgi:3-hydroxyacyl-CoA dehydrogenase/enoyl-CoA hydratase/3-hydroxybutyryl-CoA epimerase